MGALKRLFFSDGFVDTGVKDSRHTSEAFQQVVQLEWTLTKEPWEARVVHTTFRLPICIS
jgi:hypothetical protein